MYVSIHMRYMDTRVRIEVNRQTLETGESGCNTRE